jgi:hypothetical protein
MNALLARLRDVYVSPAVSSPTSRGRTVAPATAAAVLGPPREAAVAAAALALALARAGRWQCGLAAFWRAAGGTARLPAYPSARRLAARLGARGIEAEPSLGLVRAALPDAPAQAAAVGERVITAAPSPVALALAGARVPEIDALLRVQDVIVLACRPEEDPALAHIARESLSGLAAPVVACQVGAGFPGRALVMAGVGPPGGLRRSLWPAVEAAT